MGRRVAKVASPPVAVVASARLRRSWSSSDEAALTTGQILSVDGGVTID